MAQNVLLMILDGWGKSPDPKVSAVDQAKTPYIDSLYKEYHHAELRTDGQHVGLPEGQMGNSEVGHMNLEQEELCIKIWLKFHAQLTGRKLRRNLS